MIRISRWSATTSHSNANLPNTAVDLPADDILWIDLENPTAEEEDQIFRQFLAVHPLTLEDITKPRRESGDETHLPKVEEFTDYLFVIVNAMPPELVSVSPTDRLHPQMATGRRLQLSVILTRQILITHHYTPLPCITEVHGYCGRHEDRVSRGPDYLFHLILDALVDEYAPVVDTISDQLDDVEMTLLTRPDPYILNILLRLKRQVSFLRKTLVLEREVLARLTRGEFHLVDPREIAYYRNVYDHLVRYADLIEGAREMISDLMQTHLSATSNRLNQVMKVLTMISTTVLPMTLISGIYGMNFTYLPEKDWSLGYPFALGLMVITGLISMAYFRWKGWR